MPRYNRYYPNYEKLYPGIENRPDILRVLRASDRKMRYLEQQLQMDRLLADQSEQTEEALFGRETSLERLMKDERQQFPDDSPGPEEQCLHSEMLRLLRSALASLTRPEQDLLHALYFEEISERQLSRLTGVPQKTISNHKKKAIDKLRKFFK